MSILNHFLKDTVASCMAIVMFSLPLGAEEQSRLDILFAKLREASAEQAPMVARDIELEWSKSGSAAMDLLLKRGWDALDAGETTRAIEHFTAVTDHAPAFSEGWHGRAIAYTQAELYGPALADLERVIALRPRHFSAIFGLGLLLEELDRPNMAIEAYESVLDIHPHEADAKAGIDRVKLSLNGQDA